MGESAAISFRLLSLCLSLHGAWSPGQCHSTDTPDLSSPAAFGCRPRELARRGKC